MMTSSIAVDPRVLRLLQEGKRFALLTHVNADGDGLGSQMALCSFLRGRGKEARMINNEPVPANYRFLRMAAEVEVFDGAQHGAWVEQADGVFVLDNGSLARLGGLEPHVRNTRGARVCVDHHETRDDCWDLVVIDESAAASGEIVHEIIGRLGGELTPEIAEALYVSLITDTGHFRFSKTRPVSHRIAAEILAHGVQPDRIYEEVYERNPEGYVRLMGHALLGMQRDDGGSLAWTTLDRELLTRLAVGDEDTGGIINTLLSMQGILLAMLFKELPDGKVKVSLRSKGEVDVSRLAQRHGGGGHRHASGLVLDGPLADAARDLVAEGRALLESG